MIEAKPQYKWSEFGISFNANQANDQGEVLTTCPKCSSSRSEKTKSSDAWLLIFLSSHGIATTNLTVVGQAV